MNQLGLGAATGTVFNSLGLSAHIIPANTTCIDRGSPFANQFSVGIDGDLDEVCDLYDLDLACDYHKLQSLDVLKGKDLATTMAGKRNHGDTLVKLAAMDMGERMAWAETIRARNGVGESAVAA